MVWLATPSDVRLPVTQGQLARELKIDEGTLSDWKHIPGFFDEVNKLVDEHLGDDYAQIVESFKREARNGSYPHQKTYFEMLGKYTPTVRIDHHLVMMQEIDRIAEAEGWDDMRKADAVREAERIMAGQA